MPINPTTLKTLIDTQITNETANLAITPAEVGGRMKDTIDYTTEQIVGKEVISNKSINVATDGSSDTKYPSVKAVKTYADSLVVGLLDDRGNYDASSNTFPATGGSGSAGAVLTGDLWFISVAGTLGGVSVPIGASVRALVDAPAQTSGNWSILNVGLGFTPENVLNKSTDVATDAASDVKYPSVKAVKDYVDANVGGVSVYKAFILQSGTSTPTISTESKNTTGKTFTISRTGVGIYRITPNTAFTEVQKVFVIPQNQGGYFVINQISVTVSYIQWVTCNPTNGNTEDSIDFSTITIEIYS